METRVLIMQLAYLLSAVLFIFGDSFITFWLAMAVCGLGDTFRSGADQALLYDSCLTIKRKKATAGEETRKKAAKLRKKGRAA